MVNRSVLRETSPEGLKGGFLKKGPLTLVHENVDSQKTSEPIFKHLDYRHVQREILATLSSKGLTGITLRKVTNSLISEIKDDILKIIEIRGMYGDDPIHQTRIDQNMQKTLELVGEHILSYQRDYDDDKLIRLVSYQADLLKQSLDGHINATIDPLSGLYHRSYLDLINKKEKTYSVVLFDLDVLNLINNGLGHDAGDIYIKTFSQMLRDHARVKNTNDSELSPDSRENDFPIRYGGDEFLLLVATENQEELNNIVERFQVNDFLERFIKNIEENNGSTLSEKDLHIIKNNAGFTYGVSLFKEKISLKGLISQADKDMQSKKSGKGTYYRLKQLFLSLNKKKLTKYIMEDIGNYLLKITNKLKNFFSN